MRLTDRSVPSLSTIAICIVAAHGHQTPVGVAHEVAVADVHRALEVRFHRRLIDHLRRPADVEGAHGELGARLADRLGGDDADRLAHVDRRATRQVAAVALAADPVLGLAGQDRPDPERLDLGVLDRLDMTLLDQRARRNDDLAGCRRDDVFRGRAAEDAHAERRDDLTGVDDRLHLEAARSCRNPAR